MNNEVKYTLTLNDMLTGKLKDADNAAQGLDKSIGNLVKGGLVALGGLAIADFMKSSVQDFNDAAQASAQLEASLTSTGFAAGLTKDELDKQASALQKITLFGDEATTQSQALLLTFTNIKDRIFTDAVPAIQDLATKMGGDLQGATIQVGKALNDPIKGITALSRVGVSFSETQKSTIKSLVETGETAKAQQMILAELNKEFGGSAEAAAKAGTGGITQLHHAFGDVKEVIGELIIDGINLLLPSLFGAVEVLQSMATWVKENTTVVKSLAVSVGILSGAYAIYTGWQKLTVYWEGLKKVAFVQSILAGNGLTATMAALNATMLANPAFWVVAGIAAVAGAFYYAYETSETFRSGLFGLWEVVKTVGSLIGEVFTGLGQIIKGALTLDKDAIAAGMLSIVDTVKGAGERIGKSYEEGKEKGLASFAADKKKKDEKPAVLGGGAISPIAGEAGEAGAKGKSIAPKGQTSAKATTINIQIGKLIETFKISTTNMQESTSKIKEMVASTLTDALNDSQIIAR